MNFTCRSPQKTNIKISKEDFPDEKSYKKEYDRQYSLLTRERRKELYQENKEYKRKQARDYRKNNPEMFKKLDEKRMNDYYANCPTRKTSLIRGWKRAGIIVDENTFDYYDNVKFCESCGVKLITGKEKGGAKKCLDHDHNTGHIRNVICFSCNIFRRGYDNKRNILNLEFYRYMNLNKI